MAISRSICPLLSEGRVVTLGFRVPAFQSDVRAEDLADRGPIQRCYSTKSPKGRKFAPIYSGRSGNVASKTKTKTPLHRVRQYEKPPSPQISSTAQPEKEKEGELEAYKYERELNNNTISFNQTNPVPTKNDEVPLSQRQRILVRETRYTPRDGIMDRYPKWAFVEQDNYRFKQVAPVFEKVKRRYKDLIDPNCRFFLLDECRLGIKLSGAAMTGKNVIFATNVFEGVRFDEEYAVIMCHELARFIAQHTRERKDLIQLHGFKWQSELGMYISRQQEYEADYISALLLRGMNVKDPKFAVMQYFSRQANMFPGNEEDMMSSLNIEPFLADPESLKWRPI